MNLKVEQEQEQNDGYGLDVFTDGELVVIQFQESVKAISMTAQQALDFGKAMVDAANYALLMGDTDGKVH